MRPSATGVAASGPHSDQSARASDPAVRIEGVPVADGVALALRQIAAGIAALADAIEVQQDAATVEQPDVWVPLKKCGMPYRTIRTAVRTGEIEGRRVGRETRVRRSDVDAWIAAQQSARPAARKPEVDDVDGRIDALLAAKKLRVVK